MARRFLIALALVAASLGGVLAEEKNDYSDGHSWLCRPGRQDACTVDLSTTIVAADGTLTREGFKANPRAPIDCFYVYPTASTDLTPNSDMNIDPAERAVARMQFARFGSQCRLYAPMYRQATLAALRAGLAGTPMTVDRVLAYDDVLDAWHYYLQHDNNGRGIVLIGHSQGSAVLTQLIKNEIDGKAVQSRLISALLLGANLAVPTGKDVGGTFQHIPLCHAARQTGCVITYASFRSTIPPPAGSRFGRVPGENMQSACTNPAALGGGGGALHAYLSTHGRLFEASAEPGSWVTPAKSIDTPFVSVPSLLTAECVANEKGTYLEVTVHGMRDDPRTDDIIGDVVANGEVNAIWGLHLIDVHLSMGNLVDIVRDQGQAFLSAKKSSARP